MKRVKTPEEMGVEVIAFLRQLPTGLGRRGGSVGSAGGGGA